MSNIKKIIIVSLIVIFSVVSSSFIYTSGITKKLGANVNKLSSKMNSDILESNYPIISLVINSSGEKIVNDNINITVIAKSDYVIDKLYYSYDLKNWVEYDKFDHKREINANIIFKDNIKSPLYIRVENEKGYQSYAYETKLFIDKSKPSISVRKSGNNLVIKTSDDNGLEKIGYSYDMINWEYFSLNNKLKTTFIKENSNYNYIKVVDSANNESKVINIK